MKSHCQWVASNLEAFFCDRLTTEQSRLLRAHLADCDECRGEVEGFEQIGIIVKKHFRRQLTIAQAADARNGRRRLGWAYAGAAAAITGVLALMLAAAFESTAPSAQESQIANVPVMILDEPAGPEITKDTESDAIEAAKPEEPDAIATPVTAPASAAATARAEARPAFRITDPAGYSRTLDDYRGYILLFGVWSPDQTQAIANLESLYRRFGSNSSVRFAGVSNQRSARPGNSTFPVLYNQDSELLGASASEFLIIGRDGSVQLRGSLQDEYAEIVESVRSALESLGVR